MSRPKRGFRGDPNGAQPGQSPRTEREQAINRASAQRP
jgi:hypothetical protein